MEQMKRISSALISVNNTTGIEAVLSSLNTLGVEFFIDSANRSLFDSLELPYTTIEDLFRDENVSNRRAEMSRDMMVGAILCVTDESEDELNFDLLICDIDARNDNSTRGFSRDNWVRAGCKNADNILTIASADDYGMLEEILSLHDNNSLYEERSLLAEKALSMLNNSTLDTDNKSFASLYGLETPLTCGANTHQQASFFGNYQEIIEQLQGSELSYDNFINLDCGLRLLFEFDDITFILMKHCNPCGVASHPTLRRAYDLALEANPLVAYGAFLLTNAIIDKESASEINKLNFEAIIAPDYDFDALELLSRDKRRKILILKEHNLSEKEVRSCLNGILVQDQDANKEDGEMLIQASIREVGDDLVEDMQFALKIAKHSQSNAIVIAKEKQLLAIGAGQSSRIDALNNAFAQAQLFEKDTVGAVLATDRHLPYGDCLSVAAQGGISTIVLPGGALNDDDIAETADKLGIALYFNENQHGK